MSIEQLLAKYKVQLPNNKDQSDEAEESSKLLSSSNLIYKHIKKLNDKLKSVSNSFACHRVGNFIGKFLFVTKHRLKQLGYSLCNCYFSGDLIPNQEGETKLEK